MSRLDTIRASAAKFCDHFVSGTAPDELLAQDFTTSPRITEYGPSWAKSALPFLGQDWSGRRSATSSSKTTTDDYFDALGATLSFHPPADAIPSADEFIVSAGKGPGSASEAVMIRAKTHLSSAAKGGEQWEDKFVFLLSEFDEAGKIGHLEIWSDGLAAWNGVGGTKA